MFTAALLIVAKSESDSGVPIPALTWKNLGNMLLERSQQRPHIE